MRNRKNAMKLREHTANTVMLAPMYLFTIVFLIGPFVYMLVLSFLSRAETWGVVNEFTLRNYRRIFEPVYLSTFWESVKLAFLVTGLVILTGYPFGYFMAKLPPFSTVITEDSAGQAHSWRRVTPFSSQFATVGRYRATQRVLSDTK